VWERFLGFDDAYFISESDFGITRYNESEIQAKEETDETDPVAIMSDRYE